MAPSGTESAFVGSIPKLYDTYLGPMLFEPYAEETARRVASRSPKRVLEIAAGTGVITRALATSLPEKTSIVATDLNQAMIDQAMSMGTKRPVEWRQADALQLPFEDAGFDAVVCGFGVMFFPDKPKGASEARRVLESGGAFLFTVWDSLEANLLANTVSKALADLFPQNPPQFLARTPHAYYDRASIERDLAKGGFTEKAKMDAVVAPCRIKSAHDAAVGYCQGTPIRAEIEAIDASRLEEATDFVAEAIERQFGKGPVEAKMQALVITVTV